jgi:phage terminase small subunit
MDVNLKGRATECCNSTEPQYKPPTIEQAALSELKSSAEAIVRNQKKLDFVKQFPEAAKWLDANALAIYHNY